MARPCSICRHKSRRRRRGGAAKMTDDPMHQCTEVQSAEPQALHQARRCGARTRSGRPCRSPAVHGRPRCRMHGCAPGAGGPEGERIGKLPARALHEGDAGAAWGDAPSCDGGQGPDPEAPGRFALGDVQAGRGKLTLQKAAAICMNDDYAFCMRNLPKIVDHADRQGSDPGTHKPAAAK